MTGVTMASARPAPPFRKPRRVVWNAFSILKFMGALLKPVTLAASWMAARMRT
jgi:hypothetical protein